MIQEMADFIRQLEHGLLGGDYSVIDSSNHGDAGGARSITLRPRLSHDEALIRVSYDGDSRVRVEVVAVDVGPEKIAEFVECARKFASR